MPARPYKMLNNLMLNQKIDFSEDLSGKYNLNACSHSLPGPSACDFLSGGYLHPIPPHPENHSWELSSSECDYSQASFLVS